MRNKSLHWWGKLSTRVGWRESPGKKPSVTPRFGKFSTQSLNCLLLGAVASLNCCFLTCRKEKTLPTIFYFFHLSSPGPLPAAAAVNVTALAQTTGMVRDSQPVYSYLQKTRRTSIALEGFLVLFCFHFCFFVKRTCYLFNEQFLSIYCV